LAAAVGHDRPEKGEHDGEVRRGHPGNQDIASLNSIEIGTVVHDSRRALINPGVHGETTQNGVTVRHLGHVEDVRVDRVERTGRPPGRRWQHTDLRRRCRLGAQDRWGVVNGLGAAPGHSRGDLVAVRTAPVEQQRSAFGGIEVRAVIGGAQTAS
jgi:hypothetical protein